MAGDSIEVKVEGVALLERRFSMVDAEVKKGMRKEVRKMGAPISKLARDYAISRIGHMDRSPRWARMRIGLDRGSIAGVYMVPSAKNKGGSGRANLAPLLMDKSMQPAADQMRPIFAEGMRAMVDAEVHRFG